MSDIEPSRDEATGQFTNSEPLFGREAELVAAGYTVKKDPVPVERAYGSDELSLRDAGEDQASGREKPLEVSVSELQEFVGKPDPNEAVIVKQAADERSLLRGDLATYAEGANLIKLAADIDAKRAEAIDGDPDLEKHYGVKDPGKVEAEKSASADDAAQQAEQAAVADADPFDAVEGLDPETRKALKIPQVRQALEQEFSQIDAAKQSYAEGLKFHQQYALQNVVEYLPELANIPVEQWQTAIVLLHQQNPERVQRVLAPLERAEQATRANAQWQQQQVHEQQQQIQAWAKNEGAKADAWAAEEGINFKELEPAATKMLQSVGISPERFAQLRQQHPILYAAEFDRIATYAARYFQIKESPAKAIPKPVPPVSRPGTSNAARASSSPAKLQSLYSELATAKGNRALKIAAQITQLNRRAS